MAKKPLKLVGAEIRGAGPVSELKAATVTATAPAGAERTHAALDVENPNDQPLHVWVSRRAYEYDAATHLLTLYLTDHFPAPPPGIRMISEHPRTPVQVEVPARGRATIKVPLPAFIRRRVPGQGRGMSFVEEPITRIDKVEFHVQYADDPLHFSTHESPADHRARLQAHGEVVRATIVPGGKTGR